MLRDAMPLFLKRLRPHFKFSFIEAAAKRFKMNLHVEKFERKSIDAFNSELVTQ
jgi:hypothetical protein